MHIKPIAMTKPRVLIYKDRILRYSETFISEQAKSLEKFDFKYAGTRTIPNRLIENNECIIMNKGGLIDTISEFTFKFFGKTPSSFRKEISEFSPDIMHAHFGMDAAFCIPIKRMLRVPLVTTFHGADATITNVHHLQQSWGQRLYLLRRRKLFRNSDALVAVSNYIKRKLIEQGADESHIQVIYTGIDTTRFKLSKNTPRQKIILFVGRLVEQKGADTAIRTMSTIQPAHPDAVLVIIGDGKMRSKLEELAKKLGINHQFLGPQPHDVVIDYLARSKIFLAPSRQIKTGWNEGFGMVFLEAQAMGVPVVSYATGGIPEAVENKKTGLLAEPGDASMLAESALELLRNDELWLELSNAAIERTKTLFDIKSQTRELEALYCRLIERAGT